MFCQEERIGVSRAPFLCSCGASTFLHGEDLVPYGTRQPCLMRLTAPGAWRADDSVMEPGRFAPLARMFLFPDPSGLLLKATWLRTEEARP
jgi:hypothetical protein